MKDDVNRKLLDPLVQTILGDVQEAVANKSIEPESLLWQVWKASTFEQTENGPVTGTLTSTQFAKPDWSKAVQALKTQLESKAVYRTTLEELQRKYPNKEHDVAHHVGIFTTSMVAKLLSEGGGGATVEIESLSDLLLSGLSSGPVTYRAKVGLRGVVLSVPSIQIAYGVKLRQVLREDVETSSLVSTPFNLYNPLSNLPQSIAEIQYVGEKDQNVETQRQVERLISILRLFRVGSVVYSSYELESDSIGSWNQKIILGGGVTSSAGERYIIRREDEDQLKKFWQTVSHALPKDIYDFQKQVSPLTLAYDRYSDAVLQNGIVERRVTNAVMGLEALLLDEIQELSYRLGMRIAKILSLIGKKPLEVRQRLHDAYRIRSLFAHGGHLSYKEKAKLERKYGNMQNFMLPLFDYLRSLIVLMMCVHCEKEQIIDWLDDALIDTERHDSLKNRISPLASLVSAP